MIKEDGLYKHVEDNYEKIRLDKNALLGGIVFKKMISSSAHESENRNQTDYSE